MEISAIDTFIQEKFPEESLSNSLSKYWISFHRGKGFFAGRFKSKGLKTYVQVWDVERKAFYCNCSNSQNPCVHGLDLYFRFKQQYSEFQVIESEDYSEWLTKAIPIHKKRSDFYTAEDLTRLKESRTKQREDRVRLMQSGAKVLARWIEDAFSMGLADLLLKPVSYWKDIASVMVNYKMNALSDRILEFVHRESKESATWYSDCIHFLSDLYLFANAFSKIDQISEAQESLLRGGGVKVMSKELEQLHVKRTKAVLISVKQWHQNNLYYERYLWLDIETARVFYVQQSTWEGVYDLKNPLPFKANDIIEGEFIPYGYNQRHYLKDNYEKVNLTDVILENGFEDFDAVFLNYRSLLSRQFVLKDYYFVMNFQGALVKDGCFYLKDLEERCLKVDMPKSDFYKLAYNNNPATKLVLKLENGNIKLVSFFDNLHSFRKGSSETIKA